jgi:hypothetical protein
MRGEKMANEQNLIPQAHILTVEDQSKGGKASVETRRRKKDMRERLEILLSMPISNGKQIDIESIKDFDTLKDKNVTVEDAVLAAITQKALKGDIFAVTFLRDTIGEKPKDKVEHSGGVVFMSGEEDIID